jgi:hypothetical protein
MIGYPNQDAYHCTGEQRRVKIRMAPAPYTAWLAAMSGAAHGVFAVRWQQLPAKGGV